MKVCYIEDKATEVVKAEDAITKAGHTVYFGSQIIANRVCDSAQAADIRRKAICTTVGSAKLNGIGIITDLMFQPSPLAEEGDELPPAGLLVIIHCLALGVPVVVCTNAAEVGGHHSKALAWIHDCYVIPAMSLGKLRFGWVEDKDWDRAVALLAQMMSGDPGE